MVQILRDQEKRITERNETNTLKRRALKEQTKSKQRANKEQMKSKRRANKEQLLICLLKDILVKIGEQASIRGVNHFWLPAT
jgi:hypothetical protein